MHIEELYFNFSLENHPYKDEAGSSFEIWGEINLCVNNTKLIHHQWDLIPIIEWFYSKKSKLFSKDVPFSISQDKCLAKISDELYSKVNADTDIKYTDLLTSYFSNHMFLISGTNIPAFYFRKIKNNIGEISYKLDKGEYNSYFFDYLNFIKETEKEFTNIMKKWEKKSYKKEAAKLIIQLQNIHEFNLIESL